MFWKDKLDEAKTRMKKIIWLVRKRKDDPVAQEEIRTHQREVLRIMAQIEKLRQEGHISIYDILTTKAIHKMINQLKTFDHLISSYDKDKKQ